MHQLPAGKDAPSAVNAAIEMPKGTRNKVEYDRELGVFRYKELEGKETAVLEWYPAGWAHETIQEALRTYAQRQNG